jgi:hypothetical protein
MDEESGSIYYRNNVSGDTQWEMPPELDRLVSLPFILSDSSSHFRERSPLSSHSTSRTTRSNVASSL